MDEIPKDGWLARIRRLAAIAQTGLEYARDPYDRERYEELRAIAAAMLAQKTGGDRETIAGLLSAEQGYATPKVDVRAAVFRDGKLLLVRERSDGGWTLPGGWGDVGESPTECVVKEVREEAGYEVRAVRLLALLDRDKHGYPPLLFSVYKMFFECELTGGEAAASTTETDGVGFFGPGEIPPLSLTRVMPEQIQRLFELHAHPDWPPDFD